MLSHGFNTVGDLRYSLVEILVDLVRTMGMTIPFFCGICIIIRIGGFYTTYMYIYIYSSIIFIYITFLHEHMSCKRLRLGILHSFSQVLPHRTVYRNIIHVIIIIHIHPLCFPFCHHKLLTVPDSCWLLPYPLFLYVCLLSGLLGFDRGSLTGYKACSTFPVLQFFLATCYHLRWNLILLMLQKSGDHHLGCTKSL